MKRITVLLAEDHKVVRERFRKMLELELDIHDTAGLTRYAISTGIIESSVQLTIV
jgi:DNA-binding NarL/FixJ family response regulator